MFQKPEESKKNSSADKTEKIREIYRFLLSETDYLKEIGKEIDEETERLLKENRVNLEKKTYEEVRDELFALTEAAKEKGCQSIAFPLISSGIYGYPREDAMRVAMGAINEYLKDYLMDVFLVLK